MVKAVIEIDNNTAHSLSPIDFIRCFILNDAELVKYNKKTRTATYKNLYATITMKNIKQI